MLNLYTTENCMICIVVLKAVQAIADSNNLQLSVHGEDKDIPAYPALLYGQTLLIGEGIPNELTKILEGSKS